MATQIFLLMFTPKLGQNDPRWLAHMFSIGFSVNHQNYSHQLPTRDIQASLPSSGCGCSRWSRRYGHVTWWLGNFQPVNTPRMEKFCTTWDVFLENPTQPIPSEQWTKDPESVLGKHRGFTSQIIEPWVFFHWAMTRCQDSYQLTGTTVSFLAQLNPKHRRGFPE